MEQALVVPEPETSQTMLHSLTENLKLLVQDIQNNNNIIATLETKQNNLMEERDRLLNQEKEYQEQLQKADDTQTQDELRREIAMLKTQRESIEKEAGKLQERMNDVRQAVSRQKEQIERVVPTRGAGRKGSKSKSPLDALKKIHGLSRARLEVLARTWGINPSVYPKKMHLRDTLKLVLATKMVGVKTLTVSQLRVLAQHLGIPTKGVKKQTLVQRLNTRLNKMKYSV